MNITNNLKAFIDEGTTQGMHDAIAHAAKTRDWSEVNEVIGHYSKIHLGKEDKLSLLVTRKITDNIRKQVNRSTKDFDKQLTVGVEKVGESKVWMIKVKTKKNGDAKLLPSKMVEKLGAIAEEIAPMMRQLVKALNDNENLDFGEYQGHQTAEILCKILPKMDIVDKKYVLIEALQAPEINTTKTDVETAWKVAE